MSEEAILAIVYSMAAVRDPLNRRARMVAYVALALNVVTLLLVFR